MPSGLRGRFAIGTTLLQAARELGVGLESSCGGHGRCGRCQVLPVIGEFAKHDIRSLPDHLSPRSATEGAHSETLLPPGRRLGCSARILGDLVIDIPADSQIRPQRILKSALPGVGRPDPAIKRFHLRLPPPDPQRPASALGRLQQALERDTGQRVPGCSLGLLQQLQPAVAAGAGSVSVALYCPDGGPPELLAVWPGTRARLYGLAVDLGSTTLAAHVLDLTSGEVLATSTAMNPQIRFGEDLMSRISYVMMNPGGDREMTRVVREALNELAREAAAEAGVAPEEVLEVGIVCNPVMHHLLLGIDPTPLGSAPFELATGQALSLRALDLELRLHPQARVFVLPCLAGHIGADTAGMILAQRPDLAEEITLLVDLGTNAEIVLGDRRRLLAASSPTGPAFEGAQISCGQRAAPGAVERVRIDPGTLEPRFKVVGCDLWSDDPGFPAATAATGVTGICGSGIIELIAELFLAGVIDANGVIVAAMARRSPRLVRDGRTWAYVLHDTRGQGRATRAAAEEAPRSPWIDADPEGREGRILRLTQNDVRAIQLAKAALYAGIRLLMMRLGVERVERIALAGAFGSHIDVKYAMLLGLIPDCDLAAVQAVGNAAGSGACIALLERKQRGRIERILRRVERIETATEAHFQEQFVAAMALPHGRDPFPELARVVALPARPAAADAGRGRRAYPGRRLRSSRGVMPNRSR